MRIVRLFLAIPIALMAAFLTLIVIPVALGLGHTDTMYDEPPEVCYNFSGENPNEDDITKSCDPWSLKNLQALREKFSYHWHCLCIRPHVILEEPNYDTGAPYLGPSEPAIRGDNIDLGHDPGG